MPVAFFVLSLLGASLTFNAMRPTRNQYLQAISFFPGWLRSELALHVIVVEVIVTILFIGGRALGHPLGWVGLGVSMGSWIVLAGGMGHARRTVARGSQVLKAALGADGAAQSAELASQRGDKDRMRGTLRPFSVRDRRTRHIRGIPFARGLGRDLKLDLVVPRTEGTNRPVLLHIHGGAWILGFKTYQGMPLMNRMAARDWVCVNIDYRLSPMATFPDHLVDVKKAIAWIRYNIADFGGDPDFICVTGGSAGGHLTALTALTANDPEYQPGFEHVDTTVAAAVPFYGIYDLTNRLGTMPDRWVSDFVAPFVMKTGLTDDPEAYAKASPLDQIHADAPPFLLVHGSIDNLAPIEDGREFRKRLDHVSRNAVAMLEVPFAHHAFDVYENGRCRAAVDTVVRFLLYQHHLHSQEGTKPRSVDARAVGLA